MLKVLLFLLFPILLLANYVHWQGNYDEAFQEAHDKKKILLVLVVKRDSPSCNKIIKNIFMKQDYIEKINSDMVAVMVTYQGRLSYPIELYYTTVFPTLFMVNSQNETFLSEPLYEGNISVENLKKLWKGRDLSLLSPI